MEHNMILSSIFAVTIGLLILWIVLSFATIQIQEWVSIRLGKRAQIIEVAIHEMLANPALTAQFYDHPVIRGLTGKRRRSSRMYDSALISGFTEEKRILPSYIPSEQFALALWDMLMTAGTESSLIQLGILRLRDDIESDRKRKEDEVVITELNLLAEFARSAAATESGISITNKTLDLLKKRLYEFSEKYPQFTPQIRAVLDEAARLHDQISDVLKKQGRKASSRELTALLYGVAALSSLSPELSQTLGTLIRDAEAHAQIEDEKVSLARRNIEKWFDDSMDRVSGVFKRYSQTLALIIGVYLGVLLNIDMISLATYLWREAFIRQALIENAYKFQLSQEEFATNPRQAMQDFRNQFVGLSIPPIGWTINETEVAAFYDGNCQLFPREGQAFGIPVFNSNRCIAPPSSADSTNFFLKLFGILLTAFAARLGAPFWFDMLKRLVNLRYVR
jgi:hypothetical protein